MLNIGGINLRFLRNVVQHCSFLLLIYGGRFGLHLGPALPCFACPYVTGCAGYCYLMGLQGVLGFGLSASALLGPEGLRALGWFLVFALLTALLGKAWCGWVCPFGLVQDWLSGLRKKTGLGEAVIPEAVMSGLGLIKYLLLASLILLPPLIALGWLHPDFQLPFCSICPGKALLPLFAGETRYLGLDFTNGVTLGFTVPLVAIAGAMLVGMFVKERFFCIFCPLLALIHVLKPINALRLVKNPKACTGCGACRRVCPMDIERVYAEREKSDVQDGACLTCGRCVESCSMNGALGLNWLSVRLVSSSRARALGLVGEKP